VPKTNKQTIKQIKTNKETNKQTNRLTREDETNQVFKNFSACIEFNRSLRV